ncbi:plasmid replication protein RepC [Rhizobium oryzicola]|uniref:Plasmid replication protein RepC n=1 Tax=Rhizobium oryzicola TaxID=1232668 RepID=A0ABT8SZ44_9HYPH|nr:plasmid replication protein RepC [Rhizobium oryzicola]MDO1583323.1 plasmid replication protein RepC [Rhizobium oryzicola]
MSTGHVTTPFGRRTISLALMKRQAAIEEIEHGFCIDKWKVFRDVTEARKTLGLQDRSMAVLNALLSFYPETELKQGDCMIVFPSNTQLSLRAHGMAGATLRRHLAFLIEAGLIIRRDSANGKRYARKSTAGKVEAAFGFDLSPLVARAPELAVLAQKVVAERLALRRAKEDLSICRRDLRKLIASAIAEGIAGDWEALDACCSETLATLTRSPSLHEVELILARLVKLRSDVVTRLKEQQNASMASSNVARNEQHKESPESESQIESELALETLKKENSRSVQLNNHTGLKGMPLDMVVRACPEISAYAPGGTVSTWRDLMAAAIVVRSMLGIDPVLYQQACDALRPENAAVIMACLLERVEHIRRPASYLHDLMNRAKAGSFTLAPMITALLRKEQHHLISPSGDTANSNEIAVEASMW